MYILLGHEFVFSEELPVPIGSIFGHVVLSLFDFRGHGKLCVGAGDWWKLAPPFLWTASRSRKWFSYRIAIIRPGLRGGRCLQKKMITYLKSVNRCLLIKVQKPRNTQKVKMTLGIENMFVMHPEQTMLCDIFNQDLAYNMEWFNWSNCGRLLCASPHDVHHDFIISSVDSPCKQLPLIKGTIDRLNQGKR